MTPPDLIPFTKRLQAKLTHFLRGKTFAHFDAEVHSLGDIRMRIAFDGRTKDRIAVSDSVQQWLLDEGFVINGVAEDRAATCFSCSCDTCS